ncbi:MAG: hypothetical protein M1834_003585 [Cirrosporium novae-zelandiae]|nr:MAG: hypothetical protein M1834_003585 [Cirrosporium novae-zelandiae]
MASNHACDACALRKVRCDGMQPCRRCVKATFDCTYLKIHKRSGPKGPRSSTTKKIQQEKNRLLSRSPGTSRQSSIESSASNPQRHIDLNPSHEQWRTSPLILKSYLDIYDQRMYAIWPVVDSRALFALLQDENDFESYALATSLCAATIAQLKLDRNGHVHENPHPVSSHDLEVETIRLRSLFDFRERTNIPTILTSFFLHVYYANSGKTTSSTLLLREAIAIAHIMGLDKLCTSPNATSEDLRVYWLLFVTERGHSIQYKVPVVLHKISQLPTTTDQDNLWHTFIKLVRLFVCVDGPLIETSDGDSGALVHYSQAKIAEIQRHLQSFYLSPMDSNEVQRADIFLTQQWMRTLLWQFSLSNFSLTSNSTDQAFTLAYPAQIAKDALGYLAKFSQGSIMAHGSGMEIKLFDIANSLLDVINCVPTMGSPNQFKPRDALQALRTIIWSISQGQSRLLNVLQEKMRQSDSVLSHQSLPRLLEVYRSHCQPAISPSSNHKGEQEVSEKQNSQRIVPARSTYEDIDIHFDPRIIQKYFREATTQAIKSKCLTPK